MQLIQLAKGSFIRKDQLTNSHQYGSCYHNYCTQIGVLTGEYFQVDAQVSHHEAEKWFIEVCKAHETIFFLYQSSSVGIAVEKTPPFLPLAKSSLSLSVII